MAFQKEIPSGLAEGEESCEDGFGNSGDASFVLGSVSASRAKQSNTELKLSSGIFRKREI